MNTIYEKILNRSFLDFQEALQLYKEAPTSDLMLLANDIRKEFHPGKDVGWIIDRNVNITNVCIARCKFCNFHTTPKNNNAYTTSFDEYKTKIDELFALGGDQLLLQGGLNPELNISYYESLFKELKSYNSDLKLHALGPAEIHFLAIKDKISYNETLERLRQAGLDSLPGAGAEILNNDIRKKISPGKCSADEWLAVMHAAHQLGFITSATMMFGHIEGPEERIEHLIRIRDLQDNKPDFVPGFLSFIPWPFQDKDTVLRNRLNIKNQVSANEYIRMIAVSRIILLNIPNIQASWLTVGKDVAQACLHGGANDFGSIMIEENVVSVAGAEYKFDEQGIKNAISEAGFTPRRRDQHYHFFKS